MLYNVEIHRGNIPVAIVKGIEAGSALSAKGIALMKYRRKTNTPANVQLFAICRQPVVGEKYTGDQHVFENPEHHNEKHEFDRGFAKRKREAAHD
jgi:hypothetical protein